MLEVGNGWTLHHLGFRAESGMGEREERRKSLAFGGKGL